MKRRDFFILIVLFFMSLAYGLPHLNTPMWVDEFSSTGQAKLILKYGLNVFTQQQSYFEHENITTYFLIAGFFKLFGATTTTARLPSVLIGALIPGLVWLLAQEIFNDRRVSLVASVLTLLSYFEITWNRQARGYELQQVLLLSTLLLYFRLLRTQKKKQRILLLLGLAIVAILGILTHATYFLVLGSMALHATIFYRKELMSFIRKPITWIFAILLFFIFVRTGTASHFLYNFNFIFRHGLNNNFWYYHSLLWRQYGLVVFLAAFGWATAFAKRKVDVSMIFLIISSYLFFFIFLFNPYTSRYMISFFPLLFIGMGYSLSILADILSRGIKIPWLRAALPVILALLVIMNGDKFVLKPKSFYSVNHDERDIALVDYDQVYGILKAKGQLEKGQTAVIDTWADRPRWYLGEEYQPLYSFRWSNQQSLENGMEMRTIFTIDAAGNKYLPDSGGVGFVGNLNDLQRVMSKYPRGFIWIDDASLPQDVIDFANKNLHKELYLDHYALDDNPYSIWPATLYSWGIDTQTPGKL